MLMMNNCWSVAELPPSPLYRWSHGTAYELQLPVTNTCTSSLTSFNTTCLRIDMSPPPPPPPLYGNSIILYKDHRANDRRSSLPSMLFTKASPKCLHVLKHPFSGPVSPQTLWHNVLAAVTATTWRLLSPVALPTPPLSPAYPFQCICADFFHYARVNYLVIVDRYFIMLSVSVYMQCI